MPEITTTDPEGDIELILSAIPRTFRLVTVDGHSGVGKSRVAKAISVATAAIHFRVDAFLNKRTPTHQKYALLVRRYEAATALRNQLLEGPIVLDGLCLELLFPEPVFGPRFRVYVASIPNADSAADDIERNRLFGSDLYAKRYLPEQKADLLIRIPHII